MKQKDGHCDSMKASGQRSDALKIMVGPTEPGNGGTIPDCLNAFFIFFFGPNAFLILGHRASFYENY